jgi:hypothetical protein
MPGEHLLADRLRKKLGETVPAFEKNIPAILFRVGKGEAPTARALRLPINAVFTERRIETSLQLP